MSYKIQFHSSDDLVREGFYLVEIIRPSEILLELAFWGEAGLTKRGDSVHIEFNGATPRELIIKYIEMLDKYED